MRNVRSAATGVAAVALLAGALAAPAAAEPHQRAGGADLITASGGCRPAGSWTLGARASRKGIQVSVRLAAGRPARWRVLVLHNGAPALLAGRVRGAAVLRTPNAPGVDQFTLLAGTRAGGIRTACRGGLAY